MRDRIFNGTLATIMFFALAASISAAPGDLDPTFGSGGIVITRGSNLNDLDSAAAMAIQADGKIVVVGDGYNGGLGWDFAVIRYNQDGSLDTSFGGGIVVTPVGSSHDQPWSVAIQPDGKIVVGGGSYDGAGGSRFSLVRYNSDGSLDTSFNGTGIVITSVDAPSERITSIAIQSDGQIVAAGTSQNGSVSNLAIVRYHSNGALDTTFNGTGKIIVPNGNRMDLKASVALQTDGKIVVTGGNYNGSEFVSTILRYQTDGSPDLSFNATGRVTFPGGATGLAIQPDGKIVVVATAYQRSSVAAVRFNPNGLLDNSFGEAGKLITPVGGFLAAVAIQANGKIVIAGLGGNDKGSGYAVARLNADGSLDNTFGGSGHVLTQMEGYVSAIGIQADGKIVVAASDDDFLYDFYDFAVLRYQGDPTTACANPIDCADFFVRQHYRDFLNREPDEAGLAFWTNEITSCGGDPQCIEVKQINVSAAFFLSIEFQNTGYLVERMYKAAYGDATDSATGRPVPIISARNLTRTQP